MDDHNSRRQAPINIEKKWETRYWLNRVFASLLAVIEVNVFLTMKNIYGGNDEFGKLTIFPITS